jgi:Spy/CpxP family protein refolding chaperone
LKFFITLLVDPSTPRPRRQCDLSELLHEFPEVPMMKLHEEIAAAEKAGDKAKVEELRKKMMDLYAPRLELRKKYMDQFRALLTDEQKKKLDEARESFRPGPRGHKGGEKPAEK